MEWLIFQEAGVARHRIDDGDLLDREAGNQFDAIIISSMRTPHSYFLPCWVSSAKTMPGLISTGKSSDQMREITGVSYCARPRPWPQRFAAAWSSSSYPQVFWAEGHWDAMSLVVAPTFTVLMAS